MNRLRMLMADAVMTLGAWVQRRSGRTWRDPDAYDWRGRVAFLGGRIWRAGTRLIP